MTTLNYTNEGCQPEDAMKICVYSTTNYSLIMFPMFIYVRQHYTKPKSHCEGKGKRNFLTELIIDYTYLWGYRENNNSN